MSQAEFARKRQELSLAHKSAKSDLDKANKKLKQSSKTLTKKEQKVVNKQILESEQSLKAQQKQEVADLESRYNLSENNTKVEDNGVSDFLAGLTVSEEKGGEHSSANAVVNTAENVPTQPKISRAEKQRRKKAAQEAELKKRIAEAQKEVNANIGKSPGFLEMKYINQTLENLSLKGITVPSDGSCLYAAVIESMIIQDSALTVSNLREKVAICLEQDPDSYAGFIEGNFNEYINGVRDGSLWGGELEITIINKLLQISITVIRWNDSAGTESRTYRAQDAATTATITYHRHLLQSEHYNGTRPK